MFDLKSIRRQQNLSQMQFSKLLSVSQSAISKIERGDLKPTLNVFLRAQKKPLSEKFAPLWFSGDAEVRQASWEAWETIYGE